MRIVVLSVEVRWVNGQRPLSLRAKPDSHWHRCCQVAPCALVLPLVVDLTSEMSAAIIAATDGSSGTRNGKAMYASATATTTPMAPKRNPSAPVISDDQPRAAAIPTAARTREPVASSKRLTAQRASTWKKIACLGDPRQWLMRPTLATPGLGGLWRRRVTL